MDREHLLKSLLDVGGEQLALFDAVGRFLAVNRAFAAAFGRSPEEFEGATPLKAGLPPASAERLAAQVFRVFGGGGPSSLPGVLPEADLTLFPVRDASGEIWAVAATAGADGGAALRAARREAAALRAELERINAEAERSRAAKARFISVGNHDLRQPFQAMHLFHHLLVARITDPGTRDLGDKLGEAIEGAETLIRSLMELAALEDGLTRPDRGAVDLDDVLGRLLDEFGPKAEAKGLRFTVRPADAMVTTDAVLLEKLLRHLLANAVRFTAKGGVLLAARRRGADLRIEVWDTGSGIPDAPETLIDEYRQIGGKNGRGLGLSAVQRLSALLGHPVTVRSRPDRGSLFAVTVPLARTPAVARTLGTVAAD